MPCFEQSPEITSEVPQGRRSAVAQGRLCTIEDFVTTRTVIGDGL
jgi:hypothetical protein